MITHARKVLFAGLLALAAAAPGAVLAQDKPATPDAETGSPPPDIGEGEHGMRGFDLKEMEKAPGEQNAEPGKEPDKEAAPQAPGLRDRYRSARRGYQGDPGLMGLNFPQSPEEASVVLGKLYAALATMEDVDLSLKVAATIEKIWRLPGGDTVNLLVDRATNAANTSNPDLALKLLDSAVDLAPDFAEAFSRRAFVYYMKGDTERAVGDLRRTLALEPNHFKALEGLAKILQESGQKKGALAALEQLQKVNPNANGIKTAIELLKKEVEGQGI